MVIPTRLLIRGTLALTLTMACAAAQHKASAAGSPIHQEVSYKASPQRIYEALLDSKQFAAFTHDPAEINRQAGGEIRCFGGEIVGRNIELAPNRRIVQAWREKDWPAGFYTLVRFELKAEGSGTRLIFDHSGIAEADRGHLTEGWPKMYWEPLRKYLGE